MSNLLLVFMFLFFTVPSIIYKQYFLTLSFIVYGVVFGLVEYAAHYYTGQTVSQHMWQLLVEHQRSGICILVCMLLGWICLLVHLGVRFK